MRKQQVTMTMELQEEGRVEGWLKAMSPNLRLRNVLETMEGLTIDTD